VSAPDTAATAGHALRLGECEPDIIELADYGPSGAALRSAAAEDGTLLPECGRLARAPGELTLCVRPGRWLLLAAPLTPRAAQPWYRRCPQPPAIVELSSSLATFVLAGPATRAVLSRGCRLDLDGSVFAPGHAAATIMGQVAVTLAALPAGILLLTPASTARHFREWLAAAARSFEVTPLAAVPFSDVCGERSL
jgi:heterotetrameric sarcosine oxidase gamma subunit